jgi:alkylhydroperoxidase/carboxymuconolactone decarboxylase family protein YurZ
VPPITKEIQGDLVENDQRRSELIERYGNEQVGVGQRLQGEFFLGMLHLVDEVDEEWTQAWLNWIYGHMYVRGVLDDRTRILVIIGECVVTGHRDQLRNHMRSALETGATIEEIQEVILQASIYSGMPAMFRALRVFRDFATELGLRTFTNPPFALDARDQRPRQAGS